MSARRLLLIDSDEEFYRFFYEQITPYGFEIYRLEDTPEALEHVPQISPEIILMAVEEPEKLGYSLCSRAKKTVAQNIPIVLMTSSVPPSGFNSHRKLRMHADEYIDKRTVSAEELIGKLDQLIGLGGVSAGGDDVEEIEDFEFDVESAFEDEGGDKTRVAYVDARAVDSGGVDAEVEALIGGGGADFADDDIHTPAVLPLDELHAADGVSLDGIPQPVTEPERAVASEAVRIVSPPPPLELADTPAPAAPPPARASRTALRAPAPAPAPPEDQRSPARLSSQPHERAPARQPTAAPGPQERPSRTSIPSLAQAGERASRPSLAQSGERASRPSLAQSGERASRPSLAQSGERASRASSLGIARPAAARTPPGGTATRASSTDFRLAGEGADSARSLSRERELLSLRETINRKEKEVLELREELVVKERHIFESKEDVRKLQYSMTELDSKNLELEQRLLEHAEFIQEIEGHLGAEQARGQTLEAQLQELESQLGGNAAARDESESLAKRLAEREAEIARMQEEHAAALEAARAELAAQANEHESKLAAALEHARTTAEGTTKSELETALAALRAEHEAALASNQAAHAEALAKASEDAAAAGQNVAGDLRERHHAELETKDNEHKEALARLEARHAEELETMGKTAEEAKQALVAEHTSALEQAEKDKREALAALEDRLKDEVQQARIALEEGGAAALANAAEERTKAENELRESFAAQKTELQQTHAEAVAELERIKSELETELERIKSELEHKQAQAAELEQTKAELEHKQAQATELEQTKAELDTELARLKAELEQTKAELDTERERIKSELEGNLGAAQKELSELRDQVAESQRIGVERAGSIEQHVARIAQLEERIDTLRIDIEELESQNTGYQEQVLTAFHKIKSDAATITKAKKALAIALTLLDQDIGTLDSQAEESAS